MTKYCRSYSIYINVGPPEHFVIASFQKFVTRKDSREYRDAIITVHARNCMCCGKSIKFHKTNGMVFGSVGLLLQKTGAEITLRKHQQKKKKKSILAVKGWCTNSNFVLTNGMTIEGISLLSQISHVRVPAQLACRKRLISILRCNAKRVRKLNLRREIGGTLREWEQFMCLDGIYRTNSYGPCHRVIGHRGSWTHQRFKIFAFYSRGQISFSKFLVSFFVLRSAAVDDYWVSASGFWQLVIQSSRNEKGSGREFLRVSDERFSKLKVEFFFFYFKSQNFGNIVDDTQNAPVNTAHFLVYNFSSFANLI